MAIKLPLTQVLTAAGAGAMGAANNPNVREWIAFVKFNAGTSAGQVVVEAAHIASYAGTWSNVGTINWAAADRVHHVAISGIFEAIRLRVVSITGGTVDGWVKGAD